MNEEQQPRLDSSHPIKPVRLLLRPRDTEQKRRHERVSTRRHVAVNAASHPLEAKLANLSVTGVQVSIDVPVDGLTDVEIEVLPGQVQSAKVVWTRAEESGTQLGAEWTTPLRIDDVWKIRAYNDPDNEAKP